MRPYRRLVIKFTAVSLALLACSANLQAAEQKIDAAEVEQTLRDYFFGATRRGDTQMLNEFVKSGYPLDTRTEKDYTALILAAYHGHKEAVFFCLKRERMPAQ